MKDFTFVTGNQGKADSLARWLGRPITHHEFDLEEIQSLDIHSVVEHKVRQAYELAGRPVLVEDTGLSFTAMGQLPGTFIKWFLRELEPEGLCDLAAGLEHQGAEAVVLYGLYDGHEIHYFENRVKGSIVPKPSGTNGFGWDPIFIPDGAGMTYAEMDDETLRPWSVRAPAVEGLKAYLDSSVG